MRNIDSIVAELIAAIRASERENMLASLARTPLATSAPAPAATKLAPRSVRKKNRKTVKKITREPLIIERANIDTLAFIRANPQGVTRRQMQRATGLSQSQQSAAIKANQATGLITLKGFARGAVWQAVPT